MPCTIRYEALTVFGISCYRSSNASFCFRKYAAKEFGTCPLVQCAGQPVLPAGLKDEMGADTVKIFCPKCQCVYHPPPVRSRSSHHGGAGAAGVDGAAFGTTFPHLFLMTFSNLVPDPLPLDSAYVPRIFGFRVHMSARQRASVPAPGLVASSNARSREAVDNSKRLKRNADAVGKDGADKKVKEEDSTKADLAQGGDSVLAEQDWTNDSNQKATSVSSRQAKGENDDNSAKDEESNKKSKAGKRRNDGDASSKKSEGNGNGVVDNASKRRRKGDNGNG